MKYIKIAITILLIVFLVVSLVYKNMFAQGNENSFLSQSANYIFPIFMLYSFFLLFLKKRAEKKDAPKRTDEDRKLYQSVGTGDKK